MPPSHAFPEGNGASRELRVRAWLGEGVVHLVVEDNGVGMQVGGEQGRGLSLHGALMAIAGGSLALESAPGHYTRGILQMPV